jgi:hypothetical protein
MLFGSIYLLFLYYRLRSSIFYRQINASKTANPPKLQPFSPAASFAKMSLAGNSSGAQEGTQERITLVVDNTRFIIDPGEITRLASITFYITSYFIISSSAHSVPQYSARKDVFVGYRVAGSERKGRV